MQTVVAKPLISKKKTIHGGIPVIAGTRIPVDVLVSYTFEKNGLQKVKHAYPQLSEQQILAAWEYAAKHLQSLLLHDKAA